MKYPLSIFFSVVIFFLYSNLHAGSTDSLRYRLDSVKSAERAEILVELSNALVYSNTTEALMFAEEAFEIAATENNDSLKYAALKAMGYANGYLGNYETSLQNMKMGLDWYERIGDSVKIAEALSDVAYLLQSLSSDEANIMEYNLRALSIREKIGDEKGVAYSLNNIGVLYWQWGKHDRAINYFYSALPYFEKLNLTEETATMLSNIAAYYTETGMYHKADSFYNCSLEKYRTIGHRNGVAQVLAGMGKVCMLQEEYDTALEYIGQSYQIRKELGDKEGQAGNYYNRGLIFYKKGLFDEANSELKRSLELAEEIGSKHNQILILGLLAKVQEKKGFYRLAYNYLQKSKALNDSLFSAEKHRQLEEIRAKYDFEKKATENELLQTENENQRLRLEQNRLTLYLLSGIAVLVIAILFLFYLRSRERAKIRDLTLEHQLIRSQMNPHFIFNTITAIQNYIVQHSPVEAVNYLSRFASLMRQILDNSRKEFITLDTEVETLENYLNLQLLRFPGQFDYRINVDPEIDPAKVLIPPMLVQPFVENAIEHGFKGCLYPCIINIGWSLQGRSLVVETEDNGTGMKYRKKDSLNHEPFAIRATNNRLRMINKRGKYRFEIIDKSVADEKNSGTKVVFSIPYITQND
ncbi:MAG: tetratricopeptide repeat protein [Prolixibacteraceae bacterium]|nr:tetratricopeptide repeat protein [Prolixibacteraceae bacterium]